MLNSSNNLLTAALPQWSDLLIQYDDRKGHFDWALIEGYEANRERPLGKSSITRKFIHQCRSDYESCVSSSSIWVHGKPMCDGKNNLLFVSLFCGAIRQSRSSFGLGALERLRSKIYHRSGHDRAVPVAFMKTNNVAEAQPSFDWFVGAAYFKEFKPRHRSCWRAPKTERNNKPSHKLFLQNSFALERATKWRKPHSPDFSNAIKPSGRNEIRVHRGYLPVETAGALVLPRARPFLEVHPDAA